MGGLTLEEKCELAGLIYETEIALHATVMGLNTLIKRVEEDDSDETLPRLRVLVKMLEQGNDALGALASYAEKLLDRGGAENTSVARYEDALFFYSDASNWRKPRTGKASPIEEDGGNRARTALEGEE